MKFIELFPFCAKKRRVVVLFFFIFLCCLFVVHLCDAILDGLNNVVCKLQNLYVLCLFGCFYHQNSVLL